MTEPARCVVAGIDLAAGRGVTELALLELAAGGDVTPVFRPETHRAVTTDDEILTLLDAVRPAVVAIDAPLSLPAAVAAALRDEIPSVGASGGRPPASGGRPPASDECPSLASGSPYTRAAERDSIWRELGLRPLPVSFLGGLTFRAIALLPRVRSLLPESAVIEVFPSATLRVLGIRPKVEGAKREAKTGATARDETQRGLARYIRGLPEPEAQLLGADQLDALAAALTAVAYLRDEFRAVGNPEEGQIMLPRAQFARLPGNIH